MYQLNSESRAAKFYKWVWGTDVTKFKNMCPYFWKYVLTILFLPIILPIKLLGYLIPESEKVERTVDYLEDSQVGQITKKVFSPSRFWDIVGKIFKWAFFIGVGALVLLLIIALAISFYNEPVNGLAVIGGLCLLLIAVAVIGHLFDEYSLGRKIAYPFRLFGDMIRATYKNICPLIQWK